jgi:hypothetical protein
LNDRAWGRIRLYLFPHLPYSVAQPPVVGQHPGD